MLICDNLPFRRRLDECRASLFAKIDQPALRPLPTERYDLSQWPPSRMNIAYEGKWYSAQYAYVGQSAELRSTITTFEIFDRGKRVASHLRSRGQNQAVTQDGRRPKSHQAHLEWTPSRFVNLAGTMGASTAQLAQRILDDKPHPEMGYRACLGIIRRAQKYSPARMESPAARAVLTGAVSYKRAVNSTEWFGYAARSGTDTTIFARARESAWVGILPVKEKPDVPATDS